MTNNFQTIYSTYVQLKPKGNIPQWKTLNNDKNPPNPNTSTVRPLSETFDSSSNDEDKKSAPQRFQSSNGPVWKVAKYPLWRIEIWSWEQNLFHADRCQNPRDAKLGLKKQLPTKKQRMIGIQKMAKLIVFYIAFSTNQYLFNGFSFWDCAAAMYDCNFFSTCLDARVQTCSCVFFQKMREVWRTLSVHVRAICSQECLCINVEVRQTGFTLALVKCYV